MTIQSEELEYDRYFLVLHYQFLVVFHAAIRDKRQRDDRSSIPCMIRHTSVKKSTREYENVSCFQLIFHHVLEVGSPILWRYVLAIWDDLGGTIVGYVDAWY